MLERRQLSLWAFIRRLTDVLMVLTKKNIKPVWNEVWQDVWNNVEKQVLVKILYYAENQVRNKVLDQAKTQVERQVLATVWRHNESIGRHP